MREAHHAFGRHHLLDCPIGADPEDAAAPPSLFRPMCNDQAALRRVVVDALRAGPVLERLNVFACKRRGRRTPIRFEVLCIVGAGSRGRKLSRHVGVTFWVLVAAAEYKANLNPNRFFFLGANFFSPEIACVFAVTRFFNLPKIIFLLPIVAAVLNWPKRRCDAGECFEHSVWAV